MRNSFAFLLSIGLLVVLSCAGTDDNLLDPRDVLFPEPDTLPEQDTTQNPPDGWVEIPVMDSIENVQPMTGIVYWTNSSNRNSEAIALEYSYMLFNDIVEDSGSYDWSAVDDRLDAVAGRGHQAIFRFRFVYPGYETSVPEYIKNLDDYNETVGLSEGRTTHFPDWTHAELKRFTLEFQEQFAAEYDNDPRLAFIQVGFGLWAEYHIYDGPFILGTTFPSKAFQADFFQHMEAVWLNTPWSISIDAADDTYSPFSAQTQLLAIAFGVFDDSFMHENHANWNLGNWNFFDRERYRRSPAGGEFSYYSNYDQRNVLTPETGAYGTPFEEWAQDFHVSYMLGNDQPSYHSEERIKEASMATGYRFQITSFRASADSAEVGITNSGVAPIYYDAFVAVNGVRSTTSLKHLCQGDSLVVRIPSGGIEPVLSIECDRLIQGQVIEFEGFPNTE